MPIKKEQKITSKEHCGVEEETWEDEFEKKVTCTEIFDEDGNNITLELKQFIKDKMKEMADEMIGHSKIDNNQGSTNMGYNYKRQEIIEISKKYVK